MFYSIPVRSKESKKINWLKSGKFYSNTYIVKDDFVFVFVNNFPNEEIGNYYTFFNDENKK